MSLSLILPEESELQIEIKIGTKTVKVDIFELEEWLVQASRNAQEMQTEWYEEFPAIFKRETKQEIGPQQSILINMGVRSKINEVKKNLVALTSNSEKQDSTSKSKQRKKKS